MVCWSNSPVLLFPNDLMWLLPTEVRAERSHFVFLPWRAGGSPHSPLAKWYVSVFSICARPGFRSFSPAVLGVAIWDRNTNSLYGLYPVHEAGQGEKKLGTDAIFWPPLFSSSSVDTGPKVSCFNKNSKLTTSYILPTISFTSLTLKSLGMVIIIYRLCIRKLRLRDVR